jgi:hypothetical protein
MFAILHVLWIFVVDIFSSTARMLSHLQSRPVGDPAGNR